MESDIEQQTVSTDSTCLAADEHRARHEAPARVALDAVVLRDHVEHVEQLPLVLVQTLHLEVEQRVRVQLQAVLLLEVARELLLVLLQRTH